MFQKGSEQLAGQLQYKWKAQKITKFKRFQGRQKGEVFPEGAYRVSQKKYTRVNKA